MIFRSPFPDITIPDVSITTFVLQHAQRLADKPALIDAPTGRTLTYGQLADGIRRTAAGLARRGFRQGDVAAIYSPNCLEYPIAFHGAVSLGGTVATINHLSTVDELVFYLNDAGARVLFAAPRPARSGARGRGAESGGGRLCPRPGRGGDAVSHLLDNDGDAPEVADRPPERRCGALLFQRDDGALQRSHAGPYQPDRGYPPMRGGAASDSA